MATRLIRMGHRLGIGRRNYSCLVFASEHHGRDEWVAQRVAQFIDVLAYAHINVDTVGRKAIVALLGTVKTLQNMTQCQRRVPSEIINAAVHWNCA